ALFAVQHDQFGSPLIRLLPCSGMFRVETRILVIVLPVLVTLIFAAIYVLLASVGAPQARAWSMAMGFPPLMFASVYGAASLEVLIVRSPRLQPGAGVWPPPQV